MLIMQNEKVVENKGFEFSLRMVELYQKLSRKKHFAIALQILGRGTSIGVKIMEAQVAQNERKFKEKIELSIREAIETKYWLKLINDSGLIKYEYDSYNEDVDELIGMLRNLEF
jgi:four helix bundle protein